MSALGHKRTFAVQEAMSALAPIATLIAFCPLWPRATSALAPKADIRRSFSDGCFVPTPDNNHAAAETRVSISLRSIPKSIGLVKSASAPPSNALRLVSTSP
jgi:hypothetical protein